MSFGFSINNDFGQTVVNENYTNMALVEKGTISMTTRHLSAGNPFTAVLTRTGLVNPIIFIRPSAQSASGSWDLGVGVDTKYDNGTYTFRFWGGMASGRSCDWWLFDSTAPAPTMLHGLAVYKPSGDAAWYSSWKVLRISQVVALPQLYQNQNDLYIDAEPILQITQAHTATYAVSGTCSRLIINYGPRQGDYICRTANGFEINPRGPKWGNAGYYLSEDVMSPYGGSTVLVADVTGY